MLYCVLLLSLLSGFFGKGEEKRKVPLSDRILKTLIEAASDCVKETEVQQDISVNFFKLIYENNVDTKKFMYCFFRKNNYADEEGHFNDSVITLFEASDRQDEVRKIIQNCNNIHQKDSLETMYQTFMCVYKNSPVLLSV